MGDIISAYKKFGAEIQNVINKDKWITLTLKVMIN